MHILSPAIWSLDTLLKTNLNLPHSIIETLNAKSENILLKKKLIEYEGELMRLRDILAENKFLRDAVGLPRDIRYNYIIAEVVLRDPNYWGYSCIINRGAKDGIKESSAVVLLKDGRFVLAGKVKDVFYDTSEVMLLTNPLFAVPAQISSTGCDGLIEYFSDRALVLNHPSLRSAPQGSEVTVSPLSKIFPSGILIGRVIDSKKEILIQPEFLKLPLNYVVVIVKEKE